VKTQAGSFGCTEKMTRNLRRLIRLVKQVDRSLSKKWSLVSTAEDPELFLVTGMIPNIEVRLCDFGISVVVHTGVETQELWDFLWEGEHFPRYRKGKGWYCSQCLDKPPLFYRSKKELILRHTVLPFFEWAQQNFRTGHALVYWLSEDAGMSWSKIVDEKESLTVASSECFWTMQKLFVP